MTPNREVKAIKKFEHSNDTTRDYKYEKSLWKDLRRLDKAVRGWLFFRGRNQHNVKVAEGGGMSREISDYLFYQYNYF